MADKGREKRRERRQTVYKPAFAKWIKNYPFSIEDLSGELWKPVPDFEDYHISTLGRVKSFKYSNPRIMRPKLGDGGYLNISLSKNGERKTLLISRLVAICFIHNTNNKPQVDHVNGDKFNCRVTNLRWATSSENTKYAYAFGFAKSGEEHGRAKLTNEQVRAIRVNVAGLKTYELAEKFGVSQSDVSDIQLGKIFKSAGGIIRDKVTGGRLRIPDEVRAQIKSEYRAGVRGCGSHALAKKFGICQRTVRKILAER